MRVARNSPRMDEDPVGPRHWVAEGPVWYTHAMRDRMGPGARSVARAAQQSCGIGIPRNAGIGPVPGCGKRDRDMGWDGRRKAPSNSHGGLGNQSPWSDEP